MKKTVLAFILVFAAYITYAQISVNVAQDWGSGRTMLVTIEPGELIYYWEVTMNFNGSFNDIQVPNDANLIEEGGMLILSPKSFNAIVGDAGRPKLEVRFNVSGSAIPTLNMEESKLINEEAISNSASGPSYWIDVDGNLFNNPETVQGDVNIGNHDSLVYITTGGQVGIGKYPEWPYLLEVNGLAHFYDFLSNDGMVEGEFRVNNTGNSGVMLSNDEVLAWNRGGTYTKINSHRIETENIRVNDSIYVNHGGNVGLQFYNDNILSWNRGGGTTKINSYRIKTEDVYAQDSIVVNSGGNVGLHIVGDDLVAWNRGGSTTKLNSYRIITEDLFIKDSIYVNSGGNAGLQITNDKILSWNRGGNTTVVSSNGIETSSLVVDGIIETEGVQVKQIGADYVFADDYDLKSIAEVESFIKENKHLPGIEPASVTEQGVEIGEFSEKLLEKVEELTLYIIEQNQRIESLETELKELKK